ncbi:E3 ubiquitin-protein ligase TRIM39 isoform X1 [Myotis daubentonii]|uniref:E3 ubiquitin-protein ligase TRIM39 isoform X1 n=1 Tax=Myotis daubentonii TaxID=98922 RepID=UPI0028731195|nr:E3 ubiquitin-protein ligase TRIM39 isoform X1 [Myotis daubentonii]
MAAATRQLLPDWPAEAGVAPIRPRPAPAAPCATQNQPNPARAEPEPSPAQPGGSAHRPRPSAPAGTGPQSSATRMRGPRSSGLLGPPGRPRFGPLPLRVPSRPGLRPASLTSGLPPSSAAGSARPAAARGHPLPDTSLQERLPLPASIVCRAAGGAGGGGRRQLSGGSAPRTAGSEAGKEKLQKCLAPLEQKLQEITRCKSSEEQKPAELKRLVESRRQQILTEFEELHRRLDEEQQTLLSRLEEEEQDILQRLRENAAHLGDRRRDLAHLAAEVEGKCLQSGFEMLKDVKSTLEKCEKVKTMEVTSVSIQLEKNFSSFPRQYFALRKILKQLIADVTLDPETAHPNLVLSEDRKSVKFVETRLRDLPDTPRRFTFYPCVLATEGFTSGRHYWEVEVGDKTHWAVGVCRDSVSRKGELTPLPETGYWRVRLWNGDKYAATTTPFTPLHIKVKPKRVGIFLDYEAGTLSFYNVTDRSHIYTFTDTFTEKLWPLFYPGIRAGRKNAAPLTIRPPTDWE